MEEKTLNSKIVYDGEKVRVRLDEVKTTDGQLKRREITEHKPVSVVAIIAVDNKEFIMVKQFRKPVEREMLEIPAGGIEQDESPSQAAQRELAEETGYMAGKLTKLGSFFTTPGFCNEYMHLYLAESLTPHRLHAEDTDEITVVRLSAAELWQKITHGEIRDGKTLAGLCLYQAYIKQHS